MNEYLHDLLGIIICIHQDYTLLSPLLTQLGLSVDDCQNIYVPLLNEVRENFKTSQSESIGIPDKILIMMLNKVIYLLNNFPKEL